MKNKLIILIISLALYLPLFGQTKSNNVYDLVLIRLVNNIKTINLHLIRNDTLLIGLPLYLSKDLPSVINNVKIIFIDENAKSPISNNDSGFIVKISPMSTLRNGKLGVEFWVSKDFVLSGEVLTTDGDCNGGGGYATIIFDCETKKYIIGEFNFVAGDRYSDR